MLNTGFKCKYIECFNPTTIPGTEEGFCYLIQQMMFHNRYKKLFEFYNDFFNF